MGNDMFNDEQLAHAEIVQKETEDALGFWKDRALKAEAKLADKYLIEEQYEAACGDRDGLLRMVETLREQKNALLAEATRTSLRYLTERDDWFAAYQRTEALRLEAVQGMVAAERERDEARRIAADLRELRIEDEARWRGIVAARDTALSRARETDGAVREAAERLGRELSMHIATTPVHVVAAVQALLDAAKGGPDAS